MSYPKRIFLQVCVTHGIECPEDVTWCVDKINESDIEYELKPSAADVSRRCETCGAQLPRHYIKCPLLPRR